MLGFSPVVSTRSSTVVKSSRTALGVAGLDMFSGTNSIAAGYVVAEHDRHILDVAAA
jgi:hypothetical protein